MQRSISCPVKPRMDESQHKLERSEEKEELLDACQDLSSPFDDTKSKTNSIGGRSTTSPSRLDYPFPEFRSSSSRANIRNLYSPTYKPNNRGRVVEKHGHQNISLSKIPRRSWLFCKDIITTLIEQKWKYTIALFLTSFFTVWLFFGLVWYLIAYAHGDLSFDPVTGKRLNEDNLPCVLGPESYAGYFIFTVETQTSIGFGTNIPTEECPEALFLFVAQLIVYIAVEGALVSMIYAKIARPPRHVAKPKFSEKAVVCMRDGKHCLTVRVCDKNSQQAIGTKVTLYLVEDRTTTEGEYLGKCHTELKIENDQTPFILWPVTISHIIDETSPFYKYSAEDFLRKDYEVIVSLTGSSPSTGQFTESITSYFPNEIFWGERFVNIMHYDYYNGTYTIDYDNFHTTFSVSIPGYSAYKFNLLLKSSKEKRRTT